MISDNLLQAIGAAITGLKTNPATTVPWSALRVLAAVEFTGMEIAIDLTASRRIGTPLVVVARSGCLARFPDALSPREREVAVHLLSGLSNKEIARCLRIGLGTVKDHVHRILRKAKVRSRAALIAKATFGRQGPETVAPLSSAR